jgi:hypothetical protein
MYFVITLSKNVLKNEKGWINYDYWENCQENSGRKY